MRKIILLFIISVFLIRCSKEIEINYEANKVHFKTENDILYFKGEPFDGILWTKDAQYRDKANYKDGEINSVLSDNLKSLGGCI